MNGELLSLLKCKQEMHRRWKQGLATWKEYREIVRKIVRESRNKTRKGEAHLEMYLAKDVRDNEKGFFDYTNNKSKTMDDMGPLLNGEGTLVTEDVELLNAFFA